MKTPVTVTRWHLILFVIACAILAASLAIYADKAMASEQVEVGKVDPPEKVTALESAQQEQESQESQPQSEDEGGMFSGLKSWLSQKKKEFEEEEKDSTTSKNSLSTEDAEKVRKLFEKNSLEMQGEVQRNAADDAQQIDCIIRALYFEAGGEPEIGIRWVYDVIKNRTDLKYRGNETYCQTIFDSKQFSFANLNPDRVPTVNADLYQVTEIAKEIYYDQTHRDMTCGSTHYLRKDIMWDVKWARQALKGDSDEGLVLKAIIGDHAFFGKPGCNHKVKDEQAEE